jgi:hypothetical protein
MGFSFGLHVKNNYDLAAMLASPDLDNVYSRVLQVSSSTSGRTLQLLRTSQMAFGPSC